MYFTIPSAKIRFIFKTNKVAIHWKTGRPYKVHFHKVLGEQPTGSECTSIYQKNERFIQFTWIYVNPENVSGLILANKERHGFPCQQ